LKIGLELALAHWVNKTSIISNSNNPRTLTD